MKLKENGVLKMSRKEELDGENQRKGFYNGLNVYYDIKKRKSLGILK